MADDSSSLAKRSASHGGAGGDGGGAGQVVEQAHLPNRFARPDDADDLVAHHH
jgi:hypothetical protein